MHRVKTSRRQALIGWAAEMAGRTVRLAAQASSDAISLIGAGLVAVGAGQIYAPLLPIIGGLVLLVIGRNLR